MRKKKKKRETKSLSVKYFESLENRGPLCPSSPYEAWTKKIRRDMEEAGTWITGLMNAGPKFIAEYISRLQREFNESRGESYKHSDTFRYLYRKIRTWGVRYKKFEMADWSYTSSSVLTWVVCYRFVYVKDGEAYNVRPYVEPVEYVYNDHGSGI